MLPCSDDDYGRGRGQQRILRAVRPRRAKSAGSQTACARSTQSAFSRAKVPFSVPPRMEALEDELPAPEWLARECLPYGLAALLCADDDKAKFNWAADEYAGVCCCTALPSSPPYRRWSDARIPISLDRNRAPDCHQPLRRRGLPPPSDQGLADALPRPAESGVRPERLSRQAHRLAGTAAL